MGSIWASSSKLMMLITLDILLCLYFILATLEEVQVKINDFENIDPKELVFYTFIIGSLYFIQLSHIVNYLPTHLYFG